MKKPAPVPIDYSQVDNADLVMKVEKGLPVLDLVEFGRSAGFTVEELARLVHIPPRTYARRVTSKAKLSLPEGERAVRLMRLYDRARHLFNTHKNTRAWLNTPLPALGGRTPLDFARSEPGARQVENLIGRIDDGIFS